MLQHGGGVGVAQATQADAPQSSTASGAREPAISEVRTIYETQGRGTCRLAGRSVVYYNPCVSISLPQSIVRVDACNSLVPSRNESSSASKRRHCRYWYVPDRSAPKQHGIREHHTLLAGQLLALAVPAPICISSGEAVYTMLLRRRVRRHVGCIHHVGRGPGR